MLLCQMSMPTKRPRTRTKKASTATSWYHSSFSFLERALARADAAHNTEGASVPRQAIRA